MGDHEIKYDSASDFLVHMTDVKVLNSTAIKLKLSLKSVDDVTVEISENNHLWRQVKPNKGTGVPSGAYWVVVGKARYNV